VFWRVRQHATASSSGETAVDADCEYALHAIRPPAPVHQAPRRCRMEPVAVIYGPDKMTDSIDSARSRSRKRERAPSCESSERPRHRKTRRPKMLRRGKGVASWWRGSRDSRFCAEAVAGCEKSNCATFAVFCSSSSSSAPPSPFAGRSRVAVRGSRLPMNLVDGMDHQQAHDRGSHRNLQALHGSCVVRRANNQTRSPFQARKGHLRPAWAKKKLFS